MLLKKLLIYNAQNPQKDKKNKIKNKNQANKNISKYIQEKSLQGLYTREWNKRKRKNGE